ncbi:hypothetical protein [Terriglobus sp. TAA 43]|uniref:hypothetical protein n=1 Tax=Terriglobus sp. TAA 43 TaxID=278961 RepID=UPI0012EDFEA3|nr:hypothetical protein [Terriglobus sp. TAA 43]
MQQHVPFIVPGTQMFLPMMMVDLREQYARRGTKPLQQLSTAAQLIVLYHLVRQPLDQVPQATIADFLGYSRMAISRANEELQNVRLCELRRSGREVYLEFLGAPRTIWETAEPLLKSPVRKTHWIHWQKKPKDIPLAGTTALAKLTMLNEDSVPTFAIRERFVQAAWSAGRFSLAPGRDGADARLEGWAYDPALLSPRGDTVDPCSLYLSLRANADERVQKELQYLLDKVIV